MLRTLIVILALLAPCAARAGPCGAVYLAASYLTDYRFDGFSESNRSPTWQAVLHCWRADGWYAGTEWTGVDFRESPPTTLETDFYAGKHVAVAGSDLNLELLYTAFPNKQAAGPSYNLIEPQAELTHVFRRLTMKALLAWSPDGSGHVGQYWHVRGTAELRLLPWLTASGRLGRIWSQRGQARDHFDFGATAAWKRASLDLRYGGTDLAPAQCYGTQWCAPGPYATFTWRLLP